MIELFNRFIAWIARNLKKIITAAGIVILIALIFTTAYSAGYHFMKADPYAAKNPEARTISIDVPKNATGRDIAELLVKRGLLKDTYEFMVKARLSGASDFKYGVYYIDEGSSVEDILAILKEGAQSDVVPFHLIAGSTVDEIAEQLEENDICSASDFKKACNMTAYDIELVREINASDDRRYILEGYLMPGTYHIIKDSSATSVVKVFLDDFLTAYTGSLQQKISESGYTLDEILIMASVVQEECALKTDYGTFASMLLNRMHNYREELSYWNMPSTVLYAQHRSEDNITSVTEGDWSYVSRYNTYLNPGFPPGPISNPSIDAIKAVLYPEDTDYLYYEIDYNNQNGARHFSRTEQEHEEYLSSQS